MYDHSILKHVSCCMAAWTLCGVLFLPLYTASELLSCDCLEAQRENNQNCFVHNDTPTNISSC